MKVFALILASLLSFQLTTPLLCFTACDGDMKCAFEYEGATTCDASEQECSPEMSCCMIETESCTMSGCEQETVSAREHSVPTDKNCCTPCCAAPFCACYYEESSPVVFNQHSVIIPKQFPSNNGVLQQGHCEDCFQPPEFT